MNRIAVPYLALFALVSLVSTESGAASTNRNLISLSLARAPGAVFLSIRAKG
jgi:hypothetical protein